MIDGDPVKPSSHRRVAPELVHLAVGFQEHVVSGILRLCRITQQTESKVINAFGMRVVNRAELTRCPDRSRFRGI